MPAMFHMSEMPSQPLLTVDIGNTSIALALFSTPLETSPRKTAKIALSVGTDQAAFLRRLKTFLGSRVSGGTFAVILSSVVPAATNALLPSLRRLTRQIVTVDSRLNLGIALTVDHPKAVGADRIANVVAAEALISKTSAVIDCGSATTISLIHNHALLGGAILPGIRMMRDALRQNTAKLPAVPLDPPPAAVGPNTKAAIQSGIMIGTVAGVEGIIRRAEQERRVRFTLVLTGGHAAHLQPLFTRPVILRPDLTMQGLRLLFLKNQR